MNSYPKLDRRTPFWFWLGIGAILLFSIALRFWGLSRLNTLVFDEVYYAKFASAFLMGRQEFGGHPPLSTYLIAGGIWIAQHFTWGNPNDSNALTGISLTTFSYRWLNAATGALIPLVLGAIAYQLTRRYSYALIAALFIAIDGLFLVESRYALNNVYLILFGLLGQLCLLLALNPQSRASRWGWLTLAGINFAASYAIKWNGLGFLLGAYFLWIAAWIFHLLRHITALAPFFSRLATPERQNSLANLTHLHLGQVAICLGIVPALTYYALWIPYISLNPETNFWQWQEKIVRYHEQVGGMNVHPYCSPWYSWLFMARPVAYFYKTAQSTAEPIPVDGQALPPNAAQVIYDVHAMGNPFLWWLSTAAILVMLVVVLQQGWVWVKTWAGNKTASSQAIALAELDASSWLAFYLVGNWAANWLPWVRVTRCTFLYHYMEAYSFAILAIAFLTDRWLHSSQSERRLTGFAVVVLLIVAFTFWMPIYLALPISPGELRIRQWFPSWI